MKFKQLNIANYTLCAIGLIFIILTCTTTEFVASKYYDTSLNFLLSMFFFNNIIGLYYELKQIYVEKTIKNQKEFEQVNNKIGH